MTLSARIAVGPSAVLGSAAFALATGGVAASAATLVARWPDTASLVLSFAMLAVVAFAVQARARHRGGARGVLALSARRELDVRSDGPLDGEWRLGPATMTWGGPRDGFSVIGLVRQPDDARRPRAACLPIVHAGLSPDDARRLGRYLRWSLRGGASDADDALGTDRP